ncbi:hypothetical protein Q8A73_008365 [Channa argus]|nr:hypothetical protein Q8A73_008365 [Channa argus]
MRFGGENGGGELKDRTRAMRDGAERHMTGGLWRLMTGACQSSSHRENRALPSAPKLMGRRQGEEVRCVDPAQKAVGRRDGGLCEREKSVEPWSWNEALLSAITRLLLLDMSDTESVSYEAPPPSSSPPDWTTDGLW